MQQFPRGHLLASLVLASMLGLAGLLPESGVSRTTEPAIPSLDVPVPDTATQADTAGTDTRPASNDLPTTATPAPAPGLTWETVQVHKGDTLAAILNKRGVSPTTIHSLVHSSDEARTLVDLRPGEHIRVAMNATGELAALSYHPDPLDTLTAEQDADGWHTRMSHREYTRRVHYTEGTIDDSLFLAGQNAGLTDNQIMQLANIFGWDVDFALDIRKGDHFKVLYEDLYLDGKKVGAGNIVMARFWNRGKEYSAFRYQQANGQTDYFDASGAPLRKEFLRTPVAFTRISSRFTLARWHPILHRMRAHKGVDYAAPIGTPVKAAGDGKVVFAGRQHGYGNVVILQHGQKYSTLYGHLHGFARGIHRGVRVHQGQVIAYVGMTGLATGPHLHYEFRINGVHHNPLTVALPKAKPLPTDQRKEFLAYAQQLDSQLALQTNVYKLARND